MTEPLSEPCCRRTDYGSWFRPSRFLRISTVLLVASTVSSRSLASATSDPLMEDSESYNVVTALNGNRLRGSTSDIVDGDGSQQDEQEATVYMPVFYEESSEKIRGYRQIELPIVPKSTKLEPSDVRTYGLTKDCKKSKKKSKAKSADEFTSADTTYAPAECGDYPPPGNEITSPVAEGALPPSSPSTGTMAPSENSPHLSPTTSTTAMPVPQVTSPVASTPSQPIPVPTLPIPSDAPTNPTPTTARPPPIDSPATEPPNSAVPVPSKPPSNPAPIVIISPDESSGPTQSRPSTKPPSPPDESPRPTQSRPSTKPPSPTAEVPTDSSQEQPETPVEPTLSPALPSQTPEETPTTSPEKAPSDAAVNETEPPSGEALSPSPTRIPSPTSPPTNTQPTDIPSTKRPTSLPSVVPTHTPTNRISEHPSHAPTRSPTRSPTSKPTSVPSMFPTFRTHTPSLNPSENKIVGAPFVILPKPEARTCQAIEQQNPPSDIKSNSPSTILSFLASVQYNGSLVSTDEVEGYLGAMNVPVALWVAGCEDDAMAYLESASKKRHVQRGLQESRTVDYSEVGPWNQDEICDPANPGLVCGTYGSQINVYYNGTIPENVLRSRVFDALTTFDTLVTDQSGIAGMEVNESDINVKDEGDDSGIGNESNELSSQSNTTAIVCSVAGGLVALFLLVGLCRNRAQRRKLAHLKLENEFEDKRTISIREIASSSSGMNRGYETRITQGVERSDSDLRSDWYPFTDEDAAAAGVYEERIDLFTDEDIYWVNHPRDRSLSHECSAATCRVCEARRQQGVVDDVFISILNNSPPRPTPVPTEASSRWYMESDTVQL